MPTDWTSLQLGDVIDVKHGFAFKGEYFTTKPGPIVMTPGNFRDAGGFKYKTPEKYYSGPIPDGYVLEPGALVVAMTEQTRGLLGSAALVPSSETFLHNQRLGLIVEHEPSCINRRFVYYLFNSAAVRDQIQATANGAKVRHTSPTRLKEVNVSLPPLPTQQRIAAVLAAYDELIENNVRRIEILEEIAQAVYREWFIDFRFPGHEDVSSVNSAFGSIPEGWTPTSLSVHVSLDKGLSYKGAHLADGGVPMVSLKSVRPHGGFKEDGVKPYTGDFTLRHSLSAGDLVIANTDLTQAGNVIGSPAVIPRRSIGEGGLFSHHLFAVRSRPGSHLSVGWLYQLFASEGFRSFARGRASGTTVLGFRREDAESFEFLLPPKPIVGAFDDACAPMAELAENLADQNANLRSTRDLLMPKLVSGEIDVSELEIETEWLAS